MAILAIIGAESSHNHNSDRANAYYLWEFYEFPMYAIFPKRSAVLEV